MLKYRLAVKVDSKHVAIYSGEVSDTGQIELPLPTTPAEGVIVIEWERIKDEPRLFVA